ncbi:protein-export chaperone SecB [Dethiosulfovibrio acidaminovorans]|uniref:Protein-export chaperone SecB n=3 Tax=Dethiosulfovibrio TaxID=47054 RepID=A0ABS9ELZ6_9BACT|nr:protein-export chaperone SecB [Dethiosulfovibrio acidaminovorans]MCF4113161.1 protein-export chaperone SecB [Dethiosulfovibrio russensis]MCF4142225.1 protein-export chaperone SecB [Dethiosulfovibrio marinus]MCF4144533.1 protein-export chaperone SecB [Dethiosulfovibrio acidaminovorans]
MLLLRKMTISTGCVLRFTDYKLERACFEGNPNYEKREGMIPLDLSLNREMKSISENSFSLSISVDVFEKPRENNYPFSVGVTVSGFFQVDDSVGLDLKNKLIETNAAAILFPYVRSIISQITLMANTDSTLILPPVNFVEMLRSEETKKTSE